MSAFTYDPEADAIYVSLRAGAPPIADTRELEPGVLIDLDAAGAVVGVEILDARARISRPSPVTSRGRRRATPAPRPGAAPVAAE